MVNPDIVGGGVTVIGPQPALTVGAGGAAGNITVFTTLLAPHAPVPAVFAAVVPHADVRTYLTAIE